MTSLFSKPRALTSHITNFKTYRPVIGKLHVATLTLLLFLIAAGIAVTSSLWLNKVNHSFHYIYIVHTIMITIIHTLNYCLFIKDDKSI